jgi:predicted nucleic-acid-binding protein
MKSLDTNVLVRFLVNDDKNQSRKVRALLQQAHAERATFYVCDLVLLELIWVLGSAYGFARDLVLQAIGELADMPCLQFESLDRIHELVQEGLSDTLDLSDAFIGLSARSYGCETTLTFDKKAAKNKLFDPIP